MAGPHYILEHYLRTSCLMALEQGVTLHECIATLASIIDTLTLDDPEVRRAIETKTPDEELPQTTGRKPK